MFSLKAEGHIWDNHSTRLSKESGFLDSTSTLPRRLRQEITANSGQRNGNLLSLITLYVNTNTNYVNSLLINMMWYNFHVLHHLTVKIYSMFKCMEVWGLWAYYTNATTCLGTWTKTGKSPKRSERPHPQHRPGGAFCDCSSVKRAVFEPQLFCARDAVVRFFWLRDPKFVFPEETRGLLFFRDVNQEENLLMFLCGNQLENRSSNSSGGSGLVTQSCTTLGITWTVAPQAPLSLRLSRQEHWSGLPLPSPGDLPQPRLEPVSPALQADSLPLNHQGSIKQQKESRWKGSDPARIQFILLCREWSTQAMWMKEEITRWTHGGPFQL